MLQAPVHLQVKHLSRAIAGVGRRVAAAGRDAVHIMRGIRPQAQLQLWVARPHRAGLVLWNLQASSALTSHHGLLYPCAGELCDDVK